MPNDAADSSEYVDIKFLTLGCSVWELYRYWCLQDIHFVCFWRPLMDEFRETWNVGTMQLNSQNKWMSSFLMCDVWLASYEQKQIVSLDKMAAGAN